MRPSTAMVLAAGLGTRMSPLTALRPKPTLPVLNRPLISHVLRHLASHGVRRAVINSHHLPEILEDVVMGSAPPDMRIEFSREATILGTAGGLKRAARHFQDGPFYLVNSDSLSDADLSAAAAAHHAAGRTATMIVTRHDPSKEYRPVLVAADPGPTARVAGIADRTWRDEPASPATFTGVHILEPRVLESIPERIVCDINSDVYPMLLDRDDASVGAWRHEGWWSEAGGPRRYLELNLEVLARSGRGAMLGPRFAIDAQAVVERSVMGKQARLEAGASIEESVAWDGVTLRAGVSVRRCILTDNVDLGPSGSWSDSIIMAGGDGQPIVHRFDGAVGA